MQNWKKMAALMALCALPFAGLGIASAVAQEAAPQENADKTEISIEILSSATQKTERNFPCAVFSRGAAVSLMDAPATIQIDRRLDDLSILCIKEGFEPVKMAMSGGPVPAKFAPRLMAKAH